MNADELAAATKAAEEAIAEGAWGDRGVVARAFLALAAERAEMSRRIDELTSWHDDEKAWRVGAEQERDDAMQRVRALEDDCETAGAAMGAVCLLAAVKAGEKYAGPTDHAAVAAVVSILDERDAFADAHADETTARVAAETERDEQRARAEKAEAEADAAAMRFKRLEAVAEAALAMRCGRWDGAEEQQALSVALRALAAL